MTGCIYIKKIENGTVKIQAKSHHFFLLFLINQYRTETVITVIKKFNQKSITLSLIHEANPWVLIPNPLLSVYR